MKKRPCTTYRTLFLLFTYFMLSMSPAIRQDIFVSLWSFSFVLKQNCIYTNAILLICTEKSRSKLLCKAKRQATHCNVKHSTRLICIISCIYLLVSPFDNNLRNTCIKHKKRPYLKWMKCAPFFVILYTFFRCLTNGVHFSLK